MHPLVVNVPPVWIVKGVSAMNEITCKRDINNINVSTPLIIPSFSSVYKPNPFEIRYLHDIVSEYLSEVSLISAYDLYYNYIPNENIAVSDVVFIDSGNYETEILKKAQSCLLKDWNFNKYKDVIMNLNPFNQFVIVNYDRKETIDTQLQSAGIFFKKLTHIDYAKCFLYKPLDDKSNIISITQLEKNIDKLTRFDILGLTEKEIGDSLLNRCKTVFRIRTILNENAIKIPIHIFGSLDPLTIILFFLCGADIFDGLSWLKFTYYNDLALYFNNYSLLSSKWKRKDIEIETSNAIENLNQLYELSRRLNAFCDSKKILDLNLNFNVLNQVKSLINDLGIEL